MKRARHLCSQKGTCGAGLINQHMAKSNVSVLCSLVFLLQGSTGILNEHFSSTDSVLLNYLQVVLCLRKFVPTQVTLQLPTWNSTCYFITAIHFANLLFFTFSICYVSLQFFNFDGSAIVKSSAARCPLRLLQSKENFFKKLFFCMVVVSWPYWSAIRGIASMPFANWSLSTLAVCLTVSTFSSLLSQALWGSSASAFSPSPYPSLFNILTVFFSLFLNKLL